ncbi:TetR family transcriptional regulator [Nonomuraea composti]|uniref:TetR family transcriptional regulator n=1 Tax=Nonomuraea composti TaxID=2720023 RepID=UPI001F10894F|nr:TetR family transcriptional regulator [Nonomuraea sp. FMUSA5-5]
MSGDAHTRNLNDAHPGILNDRRTRILNDRHPDIPDNGCTRLLNDGHPDIPDNRRTHIPHDGHPDIPDDGHTGILNDVRTRILDAAEELFAGGGYAATPTTLIAKLAKVPGDLISQYFPRKIDVLVALVDERTHVEENDQVDAVPGDPAGTLSRLARVLPLRASPAMRRILFREADTHSSVKERLGRLNGELVRRARFALGLALPGARGDAARLEVAAATFAAILIYQENLCQLTGHQIDPDAVAELIAHSLV